ncbi:clathrin light chain isoform X2 [Coccinella septempunctata]|uniref:clathrin light chain isoform X2 n=1 Tax=Coccinella septempunctata TaxID=41139 RepID=UPI001D062A90|nr:clathrin light chain isoform X2 [Coccinella septempunctata]
MDNFDNFDKEVDPAAEFLSREQNELAGLEDEVKPAVQFIPQVNGDEPTNSASSFEIIEGNEQDGFEILKQTDDHLKTLNGSSRGASPIPVAREEPEKIRKWREEQIKRLEEKDAEEEKKKQELREIAKKELEDWYKNHEETIAKTKAANRNAEKQFVSEENDIVPGTEWERIAKLCDFNPKAKQGNKDVSRMRSLILQMKQNPIQSSA